MINPYANIEQSADERSAAAERRQKIPADSKEQTYQIQRLQTNDPENDTAARELVDRVQKSIAKGEYIRLQEARIERFLAERNESLHEILFVEYHQQRSQDRLRNIIERLGKEDVSGQGGRILA